MLWVVGDVCLVSSLIVVCCWLLFVVVFVRFRLLRVCFVLCLILFVFLFLLFFLLFLVDRRCSLLLCCSWFVDRCRSLFVVFRCSCWLSFVFVVVSCFFEVCGFLFAVLCYVL